MTPIANFIAPNLWATHVMECGLNIIRTEEISECLYEHVFTRYSEHMRDDLSERGPTLCNQNTLFDPFTLAQRDNRDIIAEQLGTSEETFKESNPWNLHWRSDCYPIETLYGFDAIPTDDDFDDGNGQPLSMLIVDDVHKTARWREELTPGMQGGIARLIYSEMDHDGFQATLISTVFKVVDSLNYEKVYRCGQNIQIDLKEEWPPQGDDPEFDVECISFNCP